MYDKQFRPKSLKTFFGNTEVVSSIKKMSDKNRLPHAILFQGQSGCGKTTLGRIVAKLAGASGTTIYEYNVANTRGIDTIRSIDNEMGFGDICGNTKVYIIDECHQLTADAQQALLKMIEEPPDHVYFIFCSTNPEKIIETIRNRCVKFALGPLLKEESEELFDYIKSKEDLDFDNKTKQLILEHSDRVPRRLVLDMYLCKDLSYEKAKKILDSTVEGVKEEIVVFGRMFLEPKKLSWPKIVEAVNNLLKEEEGDSVRRMLYSWFGTVLRNAKTNSNVEYASAVMDILDTPLLSGKVGVSGLFHMLSRIYIGTVS